MSMNPAIFFAFVTMIGWGFGDVFLTIASRKVGALVTFFWYLLLGLFFSLLYVPFAGPMTDWRMFLFAILLGVIHCVGNISFFRGMEVGTASIVASISNSFALVTVFISLLFLGEKLTVIQGFGIFMSLIGIFLASITFPELKKISAGKFFSDKGVIYSFITLIAWGIVFALIKIPSQKIGWFWAGLPQYFSLVFFLGAKKVRKEAWQVLKQKQTFLMIILFVLIIIVADFSYNVGLSFQGMSSVLAPIASSYPLFFLVLARFIFHDRLTKQQWVGILATLVGILFISIG